MHLHITAGPEQWNKWISRMLFWHLDKLIQEVYPERGSEKLDEVSFNTGPGGRIHTRRWAWARLKDGKSFPRSLQSWKVPCWKIENPFPYIYIYIFCIIPITLVTSLYHCGLQWGSIETCHRHLKSTAGNLCSILLFCTLIQEGLHKYSWRW